LRLDESVTLEFIARGIGDGTTLDGALPSVPFSTTIASPITGGITPQLVTPGSLSGIKPGTELVVDTTAKEETVVVLAVLPPSFAAVFLKDHSGPSAVPVSGVWNSATKVARVGGRLVGRYWYNTAFGDVVHGGG
jgi:hypothetical protein